MLAAMKVIGCKGSLGSTKAVASDKELDSLGGLGLDLVKTFLDVCNGVYTLRVVSLWKPL